MTVEIYNYLQRIKRLIPKDHYHRVKKQPKTLSSSAYEAD